MYEEFKKMPPDSRLWIFAIEAPIDQEQQSVIESLLTEFIENWTAHKQNVKGSFDIKYRQFIFIAADPNSTEVSGCSIDNMFKSIEAVLTKVDAKLANSSLIFAKYNNEITSFERIAFKKLIAENKITPETIVFNNTILEIKDLDQGKWETPASGSWHAKYFH